MLQPLIHIGLHEALNHLLDYCAAQTLWWPPTPSCFNVEPDLGHDAGRSSSLMKRHD